MAIGGSALGFNSKDLFVKNKKRISGLIITLEIVLRTSQLTVMSVVFA